MQMRALFRLGYAAMAFVALLALNTAVYAQQQQLTNSGSDLPEMAIGVENAPITLIEYSSLSCPYCAKFHEDVLPKLKTEYIDTGKVRYIMREFPLNDAAFAGSVIARCVDPSRSFALAELLFKRQQDWAFKDNAFEPLKLYAKQAGITEEKFNACLNDANLQQKIKDVREQGAKYGVDSTPTFFVNGKLYKRGVTFERLAEAFKPYLGS
jgi:protein-disulfide isomerase